MKITECGCNGDCACAENFQKTADLRKYFEENSSMFATPKRIIRRILKIIATIILSILLIAGFIVFILNLDSKENVLLEAIIPFACFGGFCCFCIEMMWATDLEL